MSESETMQLQLEAEIRRSDRYLQAFRSVQSQLTASQERVKELSSELNTLRWLLDRQAFVDTDMAHDPSQRYVVWAPAWTGVVSRIKLSEGSTPLEAIELAIKTDRRIKYYGDTI